MRIVYYKLVGKLKDEQSAEEDHKNAMGYPEWLSFGFIGFGAASVISGTYVSLAGVVKFYRV